MRMAGKPSVPATNTSLNSGGCAANTLMVRAKYAISVFIFYDRSISQDPRRDVCNDKGRESRRFARRLCLELEAIESLEIAGHAWAGKVKCAVRAGRAPELTAVAKPSLLCRTWPTTTNPIRIHWDCIVWLGWRDSLGCRCRTTGSRDKSS